MSLCFRERRRLQRIRDALCGSDPRLAAMLVLFGLLEAGQPMPAWEQQPSVLTRAGCAVLRAVSAIADLIARAAGRFSGLFRRFSRRLRRAAGVHVRHAAS